MLIPPGHADASSVGRSAGAQRFRRLLIHPGRSDGGRGAASEEGPVRRAGCPGCRNAVSHGNHVGVRSGEIERRPVRVGSLRGRAVHDFLFQVAGEDCQGAIGQLVGRRLVEAAVGNLAVGHGPREVGDHQSGEQYHKRQHDHQGDAAFAVPLPNFIHRCHRFTQMAEGGNVLQEGGKVGDVALR